MPLLPAPCSPLAGGSLSGKYNTSDVDSSKARFNLFPGYMARYNASSTKEVRALHAPRARQRSATVPVAVPCARPFVRHAR